MMLSGLRLQSLSSSASRALVDLGSTVREWSAQQQWLDMVERELGLLMAMARLAAEERAARKEQ